MQLYRPRHKTAHRALQALFLRFVPFYSRRYQTGKSEYNAACVTLERITTPQHLQHIPECNRHTGRCTGQHSRPIIIRYIRVRPCYGSVPDSAADCRPCQPGGVSGTNPAHLLRGQRLHLYKVSPSACNLAPVSSQGGHSVTLHPAGQSSGRGAAGRRGTIGGYRRSFFRAFAR